MDSGKQIAAHALHRPSMWDLMAMDRDAWHTVAASMAAVEDIVDYGVAFVLRGQVSLPVIDTLRRR